ncbi:hypothetical protein PAXINDRAFT_18117 [Paxillus involutus ATCC 200175]|uniref:F-box domain-containing protein n=1 Tax=Paxillus involutus ATCC 200175 TaxID=664439 RepID=A0A0C9TLW8_PAXIN|nr:hypothetical protein PAXINDRAFT_18117 [Paxillus involutus ATCC 200175]
MIPTIPPEIWLMTAQFIPPSILRNLYSVNPVFLDLALNDRYSDIQLCGRWTAAMTEHFKHLNHPHIAQHVQRLTLSTSWLETNMDLGYKEEITLRTMVAWYLPFDLGRFIDPIVCRRYNVKMCNALMETAVINFRNISHDCWGNWSFLSDSTSPTPRECVYCLRFKPPNIQPARHEVILAFSPRDGSSADAEVTSTFFQAIASTLTTLNISFYCTPNEPLRLLQTFPRQGGKTAFPKLKSFSLLHSEYLASPGSDLVQFLNQHTDTLKHLRLQHTTPPPSAFQSLDDLNCLLPVLPHLETLDIINGTSYPTRKGHLTSSEGLDAARAYIRHSWGTLTSLSLAHCSFTLHDLGILLDLLGRGPSEDSEGGRLKSLTVTVHYLSPQVLDMLAEKLPQLERLKIEFSDLRSKDSAMSTGEGRRAGSRHLTHEDIEPFLLEIEDAIVFEVEPEVLRN